MIKTGQAWAGLFVTLDATGAASAADSTPAGVLYVDGTSNAATVTITGSNPYKFAVTLPTLTAGQRVDMYITATIDTIATAGIVASAQADTVLVSDIVGADSDTLETLSDEIAAIDTSGIVSDVWSYKIRTLTNESLSTTIPAPGDPISIYRSATNYLSFTNLGVMTDQTKLWMTFKSNNDLSDSLATMQIDLTGLLVLNGSSSLPDGITLTDASITVDDAEVGSMTVRIDQVVADKLPTIEAYPIYFDIKQLKDGDVNLLYQGETYIFATSTQTIS